MWEFLTRKKEVPVAPVVESVPKPASLENVPPVEQAAEQGGESANEKYAAILSQATDGDQSEPIVADIHPDADKLSQVIDSTSQVNQLVELAQLKGIAHAVAVARKLNDLYTLDMTHDKLQDLYEALKAKGLIRGE